jgi:signal transduction histidine kinase
VATQQRMRQHLRDTAVPAALIAVGLLTLPFVDRISAVDRPVDGLAAALVVATGAVTAPRRWWPVPCLIAAAVSTSTYLTVGYPYGPILFALATCVYAVARHRPPARAAAWSGLALAVLLVHLVANEASLPGLAGLAPGSAWVAIPFTLGVARRMVAEAQARERTQAERRIVDAERLRLAQEVHDVVGHGLAAIQMQADIALHLREKRPGQAHEALAAISSASSEALTELRATLAAITPDRRARHQGGDSRAPTPGLARVTDLCTRVRAAGVAVDLTVEGTPRPLPSAADVVAYRVLQEALTNVVKHSAHPRAQVAIAHHPQAVELLVANQDLDTGHIDGFGITGMRRRVEHLGGTLTAGHGPTGVDMFEVHAVIPRGRQEAP